MNNSNELMIARNIPPYEYEKMNRTPVLPIKFDLEFLFSKIRVVDERISLEKTPFAFPLCSLMANDTHLRLYIPIQQANSTINKKTD